MTASPTSDPKAVIFDMDGVLIDAPEWHFRALNEALSIFGLAITPEDHQARFNGLPTRTKLKMLSDQGVLPNHLHPIIESIKQERTLREAAKSCFPRVEHLLMMGWLKQRGCLIGVATNSVLETSQAMLGFAGVLPLLDALVTNQDVMEAKPAPDMYLEICSRLGVDPEESIVVEDSPVGVAAAEAAGCRVIKVSGVDDVSTSLLERVFRS